MTTRRRNRGRQDGVFKKNGWWWIDFRDADGRRRRMKSSPDYELAKADYKARVTAITRGEITGVREEQLRMRDFVERVWLPETAARLNPEWLERVSGALQSVILPAFGDLPLRRLTRDRIDAWSLTRRAAVAASTYNKEVWMLKNLCRLAEAKGYLVRSPAAYLARRKEPRGRVRYLTTDERHALLAGKHVSLTARDGRTWQHYIGPSDDIRLYIVAALQTGARRGELCRLTWADLDFRTGLITFASTKNGDLRTVPMTETMRALLLALPRPLDSSARVLPPRKPLVLTRAFARLCQRLEITDLTFHDLRHDVGSQLAMAGVPIRTIAEILGHRKLEMTLRYAHLAPGHLREAMGVLDRVA